MPKALMLVFSDPASPEVDAEYNTWYDSTHLPDVLKVPGVQSGIRYRIVDSPEPGAALPGQYVAIYEVQADDLNEIPENLGKAFVSGEIPMSDVISVGPIVFIEKVS